MTGAHFLGKFFFDYNTFHFLHKKWCFSASTTRLYYLLRLRRLHPVRRCTGRFSDCSLTVPNHHVLVELKSFNIHLKKSVWSTRIGRIVPIYIRYIGREKKTEQRARNWPIEVPGLQSGSPKCVERWHQRHIPKLKLCNFHLWFKPRETRSCVRRRSVTRLTGPTVSVR